VDRDGDDGVPNEPDEGEARGDEVPGNGSVTDPSADRWADVLRPDGTLQVDRSVHRLRPSSGSPATDTVLDEVLATPSYTVGDWFAFPDPVLLVHDRERGGTFRVVARGDVIELHLLPGSGASAVDAFRERVQTATDEEWSLERVDDP
jgi:hypothetical protein